LVLHQAARLGRGPVVAVHVTPKHPEDGHHLPGVGAACACVRQVVLRPNCIDDKSERIGRTAARTRMSTPGPVSNGEFAFTPQQVIQIAKKSIEALTGQPRVTSL